MQGQQETALVWLYVTKIFDISKGQEVWDTHRNSVYAHVQCQLISQSTVRIKQCHQFYNINLFLYH